MIVHYLALQMFTSSIHLANFALPLFRVRDSETRQIITKEDWLFRIVPAQKVQLFPLWHFTVIKLDWIPKKRKTTSRSPHWGEAEWHLLHSNGWRHYKKNISKVRFKIKAPSLEMKPCRENLANQDRRMKCLFHVAAKRENKSTQWTDGTAWSASCDDSHLTDKQWRHNIGCWLHVGITQSFKIGWRTMESFILLHSLTQVEESHSRPPASQTTSCNSSIYAFSVNEFASLNNWSSSWTSPTETSHMLAVKMDYNEINEVFYCYIYDTARES